MRMIQRANAEALLWIAQSHPDHEKLYRLSHFVHLYDGEDGRAIRSLMTAQTMALNDDEWGAVLALERAREEGRGLRWSFIEEHGLPSLVVRRFIVEEDYDEEAEHLHAISELREKARHKEGVAGYTILPTTACNARCPYCYEQGYAIQTMSPKTIDKLVAFIERTKREGQIRLNWYGGEPTLQHEIISTICRKLNDCGIEYESSMVSNGSLFTPELADRACDLWNLKTLQISLDGERTYYERAKNFLNPTEHHYERVMESVRLLSERGIEVHLRCNCTPENLPRMEDFIDDLARRFGDNENVSLYFAYLFDYVTDDGFPRFYDQILALYDICNAMKLHAGITNTRTMRAGACMADNPVSSVVVTPEGELYVCEHPTDKNWVGNLDDGIIGQATIENFRRIDVDPSCEHCRYLPVCTPFKKLKCPNESKNTHCFEKAVSTENQIVHASLSRYARKQAEAAEAAEAAGEGKAEAAVQAAGGVARS